MKQTSKKSIYPKTKPGCPVSDTYAFWSILILVGCSFGANYAQFQLSPISLRLMEMYQIDASQYSLAFMAVMIPSVLFGLACGALGDKIGVKKVGTAAMLISTTGLLIRAIFNSYGSLLIGMILAGFSLAAMNANIGKICGAYYPSEKVGIISGIGYLGNGLGMAVGTSTTALFSSVRTAFWVAAWISVAVSIIWILFMKDIRAGEAEEKDGAPSFMQSIRIAVRSRAVWLAGAIGCFLCIQNMTASAFLPQALQSRGMAETVAGFVTTGLTAGSAAGSLIGPALVRNLPKKLTLIGITVIVCLSETFMWRLPAVLVILIAFIVGVSLVTAFSLIVSIPVCDPRIGLAYAGASNGLITMVQMVGAIVIPTYVLTPLAGNQFTLLFYLVGIVGILGIVSAVLLPKDLK